MVATVRLINSATSTESSTPLPGSVGSTSSPVTTARVLEVDHRRLRIVDVGAPAESHHDTAIPVPYAGQFGASRPAPAVVAAAPVPVAQAPAVAAPVVEAAPVAVSVPAPAAPVVAAGDEVLDAVTGIVAEMTGYPAELLEPDLDLEADLGVDTVKQAEVFAAVRERYDVERDENLQLRDFPTLRHVAEWVRDRTGLGAAPTCGDRVGRCCSGSAGCRGRRRGVGGGDGDRCGDDGVSGGVVGA